jgi:hypothetical protein
MFRHRKSGLLKKKKLATPIIYSKGKECYNKIRKEKDRSPLSYKSLRPSQLVYTKPRLLHLIFNP